jgi:hypothetical protein
LTFRLATLQVIAPFVEGLGTSLHALNFLRLWGTYLKVAGPHAPSFSTIDFLIAREAFGRRRRHSGAHAGDGASIVTVLVE